MHLITGMLLSFLLSKNKQASKPPLLQMKWPIETRHLLPGRVRFLIPLYQGNQSGLEGAVSQLKKIEGVQDAHANAVTGSVLIHFHESKIQADLLFAALIRLLGLEKEMEKKPVAKINKDISDFYLALNRATYDKTNGMLDFKSLIAILIGTVGIYRIFAERSVSMPATLTMLWWAYTTFTRESDTGKRE